MSDERPTTRLPVRGEPGDTAAQAPAAGDEGLRPEARHWDSRTAGEPGDAVPRPAEAPTYDRVAEPADPGAVVVPQLAGSPGTDLPPGERRRPRRWPVVVLTVMLVAALGGAVYLGALARAWSDRAEALDATAADLGAQLAQAQADLDQRTTELGTARSQLQAAEDRIVELADEKAQTGDDREIQRQLAEYQAQVSAAAASVASALQQCVSGQEELIGYLREPDRYDQAQLQQFEADVTVFCDQAVEANAELQRELDR
ncbi:hypothetical protein [Georgenia sp. AZ-5]|uniref:hypothetical protein n=1 Tax=Georgenia sp. AZ-5 TaxID=3367526 RepID=UPI00375495D5